MQQHLFGDLDSLLFLGGFGGRVWPPFAFQSVQCDRKRSILESNWHLESGTIKRRKTCNQPKKESTVNVDVDSRDLFDKAEDGRQGGRI